MDKTAANVGVIVVFPKGKWGIMVRFLSKDLVQIRTMTPNNVVVAEVEREVETNSPSTQTDRASEKVLNGSFVCFYS